jgi:Ca2+-binding RTX toxin-like protein
VTASTFSNNIAVFQQARASGTLSDGQGGGLALNTGAGKLLIENSTFAKNTADDAGGGVRLISNPGDPRTIRNTTIADNGASEGGGISVTRNGFERDAATRGSAVDPIVGLSSVIVADNTASSLAGNADGPDLKSDVASFNAGFSLLEVTTGATVTAAPPGSNITGQDPQLGGLANNGGSTETKLPATSSPAVDAGVANSLTTDQRGLARTVDRPPANASGSDATDMGAVEIPAEAPEETLPAPRTTRCLGEVVLVKRGGPQGEKIDGTPDRDGIFAHAGKDTVFGLAADDCLFGGQDDDTLKGGTGDDRVNGDPNDDSVHGNGGRDDVRGQHGNDHVFGGADGDDRVSGGVGNDHVNGGPGDDKLIKGDGGDDVIDPGSGNDFVHAGGGRDTIHAADGDVDEIICGTGHDTAFVDPGDSVLPDCNTVHVVH